MAAVRDGMTQKRAAKVFRVGIGTVNRCLARMEQFNTVKRRKSTGRPKKTDLHTERRIKRAVLADPTATSKDLCADYCPNLSPRTVRRVLKRAGLVARRPKRKPAISIENRKKRLAFAKAHRDWTVGEWSSVIWSDESRFTLKNADSIQFVRRPANKAYDAKYTAPTVKFKGGSVMVWGKTRNNAPTDPPHF